MKLDILVRLRLDKVACVALAKAAVATVITMAALSGHLMATEIERILRLLFG